MKNGEKKVIILVVTKTGFWEANESYGNFMPPTGLLALSSFLVEKYDVKIIDQRIKGWRELLQKYLELNPVFVGISFMTGTQIQFSLEACSYIKKISNVKIVAGGIHPTLLPEETIVNPLIDFLVLGEGEETIVDLADALSQKLNIRNVKGIAFRENGEFIRTQKRELINLDSLPPLPYYLLNRNIFDYSYTAKYGLVVETSRGCPFKCNYCYNSLFNRGLWRKKTAEKVVKDIVFYSEKYKINHFHIIDDNFFVDLNRAKEIMKKLICINKNIVLEFQGVRGDSICNMDDDFFRLFKKLNDGTMRIGIETGSQRILDLINKNVTLEKYRRANSVLAKYKIRSYYNFMIGFPFETVEDLKKTTKFAIELMEKNPYARIDFMAIYQPYPGTILFDECVQKGYFKKPEKLEGWSKINWDEVNLASFSKKRKKLLENIHISSYALLIRKNSKLEALPKILRPLARTWSFIQKKRMKYFIFNFFEIERIFYNYGKKVFYRKDHLID